MAAAVDHGQGFFTFLRIYVTIVSLGLALSAARERQPILMVVAGVLAILFNPFLPIELGREDWVPIDAVVGLALAWVALKGPAGHWERPIVRLIPFLIAGGIWPAGNFKFAASDAAENTMNIDETMNAENVVTNDTTAADDSSSRSTRATLQALPPPYRASLVVRIIRLLPMRTMAASAPLADALMCSG